MVPHNLTLPSLNAAYATAALDPRDLTAAVHEAVIATAAHNPVWIHVEPRARLLAAAEAIRQRQAAGEQLPLYGVPFAVKDNIDVAGCPTTAACPDYSYTPSRSAPVVERLQAAGAIFIGKTNLDQFATGLVGTRSPYGACHSAFSDTHVSGGSSSGSALAVALGQVSFALGTDTAGSGRVPASFNNIAGLKPTRGLISTLGVVPACRSLDCVSIFALTADDAYSVLEHAAAYEPDDPYSRAQPQYDGPTGTRLRCGVPERSALQFFGDAQAQAAFARARAQLDALGVEWVEIDFAPFAAAARLLYEGPWVAERLSGIEAFYASRSDALLPVTRQIIGQASRFSAADFFSARHQLEQLRRRAEQEWRLMDMLIVPTAPTHPTLAAVSAEPIARNSELGYYTNFVNLFDLAAHAVPCNFRPDGLPAGITLIGPAGSDALLARTAARLQCHVSTRLGATTYDMPHAPARDNNTSRTRIAVVGAHLSGMPLNHQLTSRGAHFVSRTATAPCYRLYALADQTPPKPGLVRVADETGRCIEVEVWDMPARLFGSFLAEVPAPLTIGTVVLEDGTSVHGFLCEPYATRHGEDITSYGGWRAFLASRGTATAP